MIGNYYHLITGLGAMIDRLSFTGIVTLKLEIDDSLGVLF